MAKNNKRKNKNDGGGRKVYTGKLEVTRSGMGFVVVPDLDSDIMIERENMNNALNGDEVKVEVRGYFDNNKRLKGTITEIVRRKQTEFSGRVEVHPHFAFLVPESDKMPVDIYIPLHLLNGAQNGDHAMGRIVEWTGKTKNPVGEIVSVLTHESVNEIAMQGLLVENGFPLTFPDDVLEDAARYPEGIDKQEIKNRKDMRNVLTMTIDPVDAKDFDDALSFRELKDGLYEVGVHIADVAHYIEAGSALDKEAYQRATSVYLPDRVLPMLPERLSNELCSLRPHEDKYTFSVIFQINKQGKVKDYSINKTLIHSDRRFTYEEVQEIIEGAGGDHEQEIHLMNAIARNLRQQRFKKGAINFSSQEVRFELDESGRPIGIVVKESKEAHQLIEEFMLLANRTVAEYVGSMEYKGDKIPFPYRVHDVPDEDKLRVFTLFAARFGVKFDLGTPEAIARSFNQMLETVEGKPEQHVLEQLGIRTMSKAVYTTDNIGHYGLGFEHYCHFTSPIRRYPDVLVHRILLQCIEDNVKPIKHLEAQCRHCSDQERRAMEAERAANKYKQVEYMQDYVGEDFDAVISGVAAFGFWAETVEHKCEGMVSANDLAEFDDFVFNEGEYALVGRHTGLRFAMGDKVRVKVTAANLAKRQIDYQLLEVPQTDRKGTALSFDNVNLSRKGRDQKGRGKDNKKYKHKKR
ncbi:MAG: rnr [Flavipsychrobacter sp.]|jgi:ribonuclease R|nr:rnr [Flavipsychrobacter sp.]